MIDFKTYYNKVPKVYLKAIFISLGILVLIVIGIGIFVFQKRESLLAEAITKAKVKAKEEYNIDLKIGNYAFSGFKTVVLDDIIVLPENQEQLLGVKHLEVSVKLFPLLSGTVKIDQLNVSDASLNLVKQDSTSNYDFIIKPKKDTIESKAEKEPMNLGKLADRMISSILYKIPENMELRNFEMSYKDDSLFQKVTVPTADIDNGKLSSTINVDKSTWHLQGKLNPGHRRLYLKLFADGEKVEFPLLESKYGLKLAFDTVETNLENVKWRNKEEFLTSGTWKVSNLLVNHWRIASNDVIVPHGFLDAEVVIGKDFIALDKTSEVKIAKLVAFPYAKITLAPHKTYALGVRTDDILAQDVFDSFPKGLFTSLEGIRVSGQMNYTLDFFLDTQLPDSVILESSLVAPQFQVNAWGKTDLAKINSPFVYTPYEDGNAQRSIVVGPSNPNYVRLDQVSPYLKNAILTSEDNSFFQHEGFNIQAIRASIATNFKEKAFKRGGSTISMQLVKNVYLDREKTLARKVEEMLIVWLIEHNNIVSKERMFEVYLNIIEWGRNVYGVNEASHYYFSKSPSELSLGESIFLASIVPRPKISLSRFDHTGHLKPYMSGYFRLIGGLMAQRGHAAPDSTQTYEFYSVNLREALRPMPPKVDSVEIADSTHFLEEEIEGVKRMLQNLFKGKSEKDE
ncbi:MAG TPA: transglycosylase domain-containing protein [Sphingobacteriaceae bacterium]|nr:transglycosylase domain-containing protein [Sphingobacteriaceae bacterium]